MTSLECAKHLLWADADNAWGDLSVELVRSRKILLTGASGLMGSHFLAALLRLQRRLLGDIEVHAVMHAGAPEWFRGAEIQVHEGDLVNPAFIDSLPVFDIVIHAATYSQPALFTKDPTATIKLNTATTMSLLDKVAPDGRFLFISSSELYSGLENPPYREDQIGVTNTTHPRACYIEGKRCGEAICFNYHREGVQAKAARLCLAYGPGTRQGDQRVLNAFIEQALRKGAIQLMDDGSSRRTYCYVSDAMFMLWRILFCGKQCVYNVGGISHTSILELAHLIGQELGVPVSAVAGHTEGIAGAPKEVAIDCSRFEKEFGPLTYVAAGVGIARTIEWQKYLYGF